MAAHNDFAWFRGEDILITFTMTPLTDITGWTISAKVKTAVQEPTALLTIAGTVTSAAAGIFTVAVTAAQNTSTLAVGRYDYSVTRTDSGSVAVLSEGTITVKPSAQVA